VNLAKAAAARARSAVQAAEADREAALGELRALLAFEPGDTIAIRGGIAARGTYVLDRLLDAAVRRPDLGMLDAERAEGQAEIRLGDGYAWPDLRLGVSYAREEDADILRGGLTFTLPFFDRGQEHRAVGRARATRASIEQTGLVRTILAEVRTAFAVYQKRVEAVDEYEKNVLPLADENDAFLRKSFEAGQMGLSDYLVARRELIDARREYLDRLLELAEAAVELETAAGVLK
jgi:cobalt-zinc-cadmium efflux system outer membrane protein